MSHDKDGLRLKDIDAALKAIDRHLSRGPLDDPLVFDAVRIRLIEIGEAVKDLGPHVTQDHPSIPWRQIGRTWDNLVHRYFNTSHEIVQAVVVDGLPPLRATITALLTKHSGQQEAAGQGADERPADDDVYSGAQTPRAASSRRIPPGPEGSKGRQALAGVRGVLVLPGRSPAGGRLRSRSHTPPGILVAA